MAAKGNLLLYIANVHVPEHWLTTLHPRMQAKARHKANRIHDRRQKKLPSAVRPQKYAYPQIVAT